MAQAALDQQKDFAVSQEAFACGFDIGAKDASVTQSQACPHGNESKLVVQHQKTGSELK
jgi:hypothetical protein